MPKIFPYKAVRPHKEKVELIVSKSYETYTEKVLDGILRDNTASFLHILWPGYKKNTPVSGKKRYNLVKERFTEFKKTGILCPDRDPSLYIYKIEKKHASFCGILAATRTDDYENGNIKKHENTIEKREKLFKNYLKVVKFNAEPVLLTYPDNKIIKENINKITSKDFEYSFTVDGAKHSLWKLSDEKIITQIQQEFEKINTFYIADGHHRCASSHLLSKEMKFENPDHTGTEAYNYFLSYLLPESELKIYEFNRLIKDLNGLTKDEFLTALKKQYHVVHKGPGLYRIINKHEFGMYLEGEFYLLLLKEKGYQFKNVLSELDAQLLYETILEPILNIKDLRNDKRIDYIYGKESIVKIKELIDSGKYKLAFNLAPVTVSEIKEVANQGLQMPPKSTYIEPKLLSALTIYEIE